MIKKELKETTKMRRKMDELSKEIAKAKKAGQTEQAKQLETELNALKRSVKDYEDRIDPQGKHRKG